MNRNPYRYFRFCAWAGMLMLPATVLLWGILGQNIPPYSPALAADEFAAAITEHATTIRIGMIGQLGVSFMYFLWGLVTARIMEKVEEDNNILSSIALWAAGLTTIVFLVPCTVWLTVAFRPEAMEPKTLQMFYDFGWFFFDNTFTVTSMGMVAMGVCFLGDRRPEPLIPAWVCWLAICVGIGFILEVFMPLFKSGVFSRAGTINYWVEFTLFFVYWAVTATYIIKAIPRLEAEHRQQAA
ncbi:MAG: hypothetical protein AB7Q81_20020 [Gammaproteobacteria bacterium]